MSSPPAAGDTTPVFLQLAAHPIRWRLLCELATSDLPVRELVEAVGEQQNLVSYHLGKLRSAEVVSVRRSSADARDNYYSLDLARVGDLLGAAGAALHPSLSVGSAPSGPSRNLRRPRRVLFICTGNSARSQMAEAFVRARAHGSVVADSAGTHPKPLHPNAVRVMSTYGIDIGDQRSKHTDTLGGEEFDVVITLCDKARRVGPVVSGRPRRTHWSLPDPAAAGGAAAATYPAFQAVAADISVRVGFLLLALANVGASSPKEIR